MHYTKKESNVVNIDAGKTVTDSFRDGDQSVHDLRVFSGTELDLVTTGAPATLTVSDILRNEGSIVLTPGTTLGLTGEIYNSGTMTIDAATAATGATLLIHGVADLYGGGKVILDGPADKIVGDGSAATLSNSGQIIEGIGTLGGDGLTLVNGSPLLFGPDSGIYANGGLLVVNPSTFTNHGFLLAENGGTLQVGNLDGSSTITRK